jgi:polyhydroxyalkanoate synthase
MIKNALYASTPDKWKLAIKRYKPSGKVAKYPVILCHGLGGNASCMDFGRKGSKKWERYSLAAYLYEGGDGGVKFDVWVAELRGRNGSQTFSPFRHPEKYNWCVDDYINKDMPSIIDLVRRTYYMEKKRHPKIFWVGKSMGGMIAYAYGEGEGKRYLKGVVTMGSPVAFEYVASKEWPSFFRSVAKHLYPRRISIPVRWVKVIERVGVLDRLKHLMANEKNIYKQILREYFEKSLDNTIASRVFSHFAIFIKYRDFCQYPKNPWLYDIFYRIPFMRRYFAPYSYKHNLRKFTPPLLAIAGGGDKTAPPEEIKYAFENVSSKDKKYIEFSVENGYSANYGHIDLNLGKKAKEEVYPAIYEWLVKRC